MILSFRNKISKLINSMYITQKELLKLASRFMFKKCHFSWEWLTALFTVVNEVAVVML
jgi:hypothetical protein